MAEVHFALANYTEERMEPTDEEKTYLLSWQAKAQAEAAAAAELDPDGTDALGGATSPPLASRSNFSGRVSKHRLWQSTECRERFRSSLRNAHCAALVSLALKSFRTHAAAFGTLGWRPARGKEVEDKELALSAWVHADAFAFKGANKHKKK